MKRQSKVMSIVALAVCVVGLTIGFAAFSNTLTIKSSATVTPNSSEFKLGFSTTADSLTEGTIVPTVSGTAGATASNVVINNTMSDGKIALEPLSVAFTSQNQTVEYELYIYNSGKYTAYLYEAYAVEGQYEFPDCKTVSGKDNPLLEEACLAIGSQSLITIENPSGTKANFLQGFYDPLEGYSSFGEILAIEPGESQKITIKLGSGSALIDEDITVEYGSIRFYYSTVKPEI